MNNKTESKAAPVNDVALYDPFAPVETTKMEIMSYGFGEPTGAFITGCTPDSAQWRKNKQRLQASNQKDQKLHIGKSGTFINLKAEYREFSDDDLLLVQSITDVTGIPGYNFSPDTIADEMLVKRYPILQQWAEHMDNRMHFLEGLKSPLADG